MKKLKVFYLAAICLLAVACNQTVKTGVAEGIIVLEKGWKFSTGNDVKWADLAFDDSSWKPILVDRYYEEQGWPDYNGLSWYRIKFKLPSSMKDAAYLKDSIQIFLGMIDDFDITYLNGNPIGMDNKNIQANQDTTGFTRLRTSLYDVKRKYKLAVNDERIHWDQENVIAIKVYDPHYAGGVFCSISPYVSMVDIKDVVSFDINSSPFKVVDNNFSKTFSFSNNSTKYNLTGKLSVKVKTINKGDIVFEDSKSIEIKKGEKVEMPFSYQSQIDEPCITSYIFTEHTSNKQVEVSQEVPYFLTPSPKLQPRINGPLAYGCRPGHPFLYLIPCQGERPIQFSVKGLPDGLKLDPETGIISGITPEKGEYQLVVEAINPKGKDSRNFKIIAGDKIALTPPMGWNHWNAYTDQITDKIMREAACLLISSGMADVGYQYVNMDNYWMNRSDNKDPKRVGPLRDGQGNIVSNSYFPDMKGLTGYIHAKGLKAGIYKSMGPLSSEGLDGAYQQEEQDARQLSSWGFDFLKYDWSYYKELDNAEKNLEIYRKPYRQMGTILKSLDRDIVFNICQYGMGDVWKWGGEVGGNCWRITWDLNFQLDHIFDVALKYSEYHQYSKPGEWNDLDYIYIGWGVRNVEVGGNPEPSSMPPSLQYSYMSLWSLMASPLIYSGDLSKLDAFTLNVLCNPEVIEVNQDPLGESGLVIMHPDSCFLMVKNMYDGSKAIGLFNRGKKPAEVTANWSELQISGNQSVHDIWRQKELGVFKDKFSAQVPAQGVVMVKISKR